MELINRYIYAVTQKLPSSQRKDIAEELQSLIEDMLEERVGGGKWHKEDIKEVLLELGSPRELADKYRGEKKYLIGPELFDAYVLVLKIVFIVVSAVMGISFIIETMLHPVAIMDHLVELLTSLVTALPSAFAWTTISFAIGEFFTGKKQKDLLGQEWNPMELPPIPDEKRKIKRGDSIAAIVFYSLLLVFLAFSSERFGIWVFDDEFVGVVPFLNEQTYGTYLLFIFFIFGIGIVKECLKLVIGKWTYPLAIFTTIVNVISTAGILWMISGPDFWNPLFMDDLVAMGLITQGSEAYEIISSVWDQVTFWLLVLLVIGLIIDAVTGFYKARKTAK